MEEIKNKIVDYLKSENISVIYFDGIEADSLVEDKPIELKIKINDNEINKWKYFVSRINDGGSNRHGKNKRSKKACICASDIDLNKKRKKDFVVAESYNNGTLSFIFNPPNKQGVRNMDKEVIKKRLNMFFNGLQRKYYTVYPTANNFTVICKVTHRCNLDCKYCYDKPHREKIKCDMSTDIYEKILSIASKYTKKLSLIYHGGEPTVVDRKWYEKVHEEIIPKYPMLDIEFKMMSNGVAINEEWGNLFSKYNIRPGLSYNANCQEELRVIDQLDDDQKKNKAVSDKVLEVLKSSIPGGVIDVITKKNYKNLIEIYEFYKKLDRGLVMNPVFYSEGSEQNGLELSVEEYMIEWKKFFKYWIHDKDGIDERTCSQMLLHLVGARDGLLCEYKDCRKGWIGVNPLGNIYPCGRFYPEKYNFGSVFDFNSIEDIFKSDGYKEYSKEFDNRLEDFCKKCDYYSICGGYCSNTHLLYTGSLTKVDENSCKMIKLQFDAAYDALRDIDLINDEFNPHAKKIMIENGFYSVKEIKEILDSIGVNIPLDYDPNNLIKCGEYEVFRGINYVKNDTAICSRHIDYIDSDEESIGLQNQKNRIKDLIVYLRHVAEDIMRQKTSIGG